MKPPRFIGVIFHNALAYICARGDDYAIVEERTYSRYLTSHNAWLRKSSKMRGARPTYAVYKAH